MKTVNHIFALAAFAATIVSCVLSPEYESMAPRPESVVDSVSFLAVLDNDDSRTTLNGLEVLWADGDNIKVFTKDKPSGVVFTLSAGAGTVNGTFSGQNPGSGPFYAVYPAEAGKSLSGGQVTLELPSSQLCAAGTFGKGANISAGTANKLEWIRMRNVLGAVELQISGSGTLSEIRLLTLGSEVLHGPATLSGLDSGAPSLKMTGKAADENLQKLTLTASGVTLSETPSKYYLMLPPGTLAGGFLVETETTDGRATVKHAATGGVKAIERSVIRPMPAFGHRGGQSGAFLRQANYGAWANVSPESGELAVCCLFDQDKGQLAWLTGSSDRYMSFRDWNAGYSLGIKVKSVKLVPGNTENASVTAFGDTGSLSSSDSETVEIIKVFGGKVWMKDSRGFGYIMPVKD